MFDAAPFLKAKSVLPSKLKLTLIQYHIELFV
jgi:hypothetical protein